MLRRSPALALLALAALLAAACGGGGSPSPSGAVTVHDAWARTSTAMELAGAAYLVIDNGTFQDDALVGATSTAAETVEIHETTMTDSMTGMHPVDRVELPAGQSVTFKPGGYHIMLIGLKAPLEAGKTIELTLDFEHAPDVTVTAEVRAS